MMMLSLIHMLVLGIGLVSAQCRLRPFHLHDQIYGSCTAFSDLSPKNESNFAIAAGPFPCGSCVQVQFQQRQVHVIIVDSTSVPGLDLHLDPMIKLAGAPDPSLMILGLPSCQATLVALDMCNPSNDEADEERRPGLHENTSFGNHQAFSTGGVEQQNQNAMPPPQPWMNRRPEQNPQQWHQSGFNSVPQGQALRPQHQQQQFQPQQQQQQFHGHQRGWQQQQQQQQQQQPGQYQQQFEPRPLGVGQQPNMNFVSPQAYIKRRKTQIRVYD